MILCGHDGRRGGIYHTAVRETMRRKSIGRALVQASLETLKQENISKVFLVVFKRNETGNGFWENEGFRLREDLNYRDFSLRELQRIDT